MIKLIAGFGCICIQVIDTCLLGCFSYVKSTRNKKYNILKQWTYNVTKVCCWFQSTKSQQSTKLGHHCIYVCPTCQSLVRISQQHPVEMRIFQSNKSYQFAPILSFMPTFWSNGVKRQFSHLRNTQTVYRDIDIFLFDLSKHSLQAAM